MATQSEIVTRIQEAEVKLHSLLTGGGVVEVQDVNGSRVRYTDIDADKLRAYISGLQSMLTVETTGVTTPRRAPIGFWF
jgi:hypothetical protein